MLRKSTKKATEHEVKLTGRYQGSGRGFGFLIPEGGSGREDDCFIPPRQSGGAWDGDTVEAVLEPEDPSSPGRRVARVTKVLQRGNEKVTGVIQKVNRELWLRPDNERLPGPIKVIGRTKVREGEKAAVMVTGYGTALSPATGTLCATFGPSGSRPAAVEAILYQQDVQREFPQEVLDEAHAIPQSVPAAALKGRLDLRDKTIITIDGASSKDLDDAVSLEKDGENWVLGVHIADVSAYVRPGTPLDDEAFHRGTSVYFADQVVPMLPVALSNGICSLNPQVDRLTLSCFMTMDRTGAILDHSVAQSVIRSTERMTYEDCNLLLADQSPALAEHYAHILPMLKDMAVLARALEKRRRARGSLDLDSAESYIICDSEGKPVDIKARSQGESEKLIESFMLAANETVAQHLFDHKKPAVYRVHEKPSQEKTEALKAMLSPLGYSIQEATGPALQKVLDAAKGKPEAPAVSMMVLRSLMKATYSPENLGHFGIAAPYYCHFTSPIRRYPDLMVHRCLHALLDGAKAGELKKLAKSCEKAAQQSSQREIAAQTAERDIDKLYFADYMHDHLGESFTAAVSGVTKFGLFAALPNGVEGLIPVETLPEDRYDYDEVHLTLIGEGTGNKYTFGMELPVVCVSADPSTGRIEFRLPGREQVESRPKTVEKPLPTGRKMSGRSKGKKPGAGKEGGGKPSLGKRRGNRPAMHIPKSKKRGKGR
jgi:ribonuclease R